MNLFCHPYFAVFGSKSADIADISLSHLPSQGVKELLIQEVCDAETLAISLAVLCRSV